MKTLILNLAFLFSILSGLAQNRFLIKNVKVFDGATILPKTSVLVENGKISEVGNVITDFDEMEIIDGTGKTLIPALSNAHVHAWSVSALQEAAKAGVLNVMDMHGVETYQTQMRNLKDSVNYANYYVAGYAATAPEGHGTQYGFPVPTIDGPNAAKKFIKDRIASNVDYIKIISEPWKPTLSSETISELIKEAHNVNKKAVVHISRLEDAVDVISNDADGLVHIWWDREIENSALKALSEEKTFFVIPTVLTTIKVFELMGDRSQNYMSKAQILNEVKKLHDADIPILAGTDPPNANINYGSDLYKEMELLSKAGLSNVEVLKAATVNVVNAFDLKNTGFIKKGFFADLVLIDGDPTLNITDISKIERVWKKGNAVKL